VGVGLLLASTLSALVCLAQGVVYEK